MRRGDAERIYQALRADIFARLTQGERVNAVAAEDWITGWEERAQAEGLSRFAVGFWDTAWEWISVQRRRP